MNDYGNPPPGPAEPDDRGPWYDEAHRRVQTPGSLMQLFGVLSLFLTVAYTALLFVAPDVVLRGQYDFVAELQKGQVANRMPPYEEWVKSQQIQSGLFQILALIGSVLIFLAGNKMKQLQSYGLCITGSIMAILPVCTNNCCCFITPVGVWAIVVLLNADVKLAFSRNVPRVEEQM